MISVSERELVRAWRKHMQAFQKLGSDVSHSRNLLLFYAVECLVKARLLRYYRVDSYDKLPEEARIGHNINSGLDQLRVSVGRVPDVAARDRSGSRIQHDQLHEAWRYEKILEQCEQRAVDALQDIVRRLEDE